MMRWILLFAIFTFLMSGCADQDRSPEKNEKLTQLRGEFQFTIHPNSEVAVSLTRFSLSPNGTGVGLPGFELFLNGIKVEPDSTEMNGVFYEMEIPIAEFFREHTIELRSASESFSEKFSARPFSLDPGFRDADRQNDLEFGIKGLSEGENVLISMVDTSFDNNDLLRKFPATSSRVVVPAAELQNLVPGPISAEILYEKRHQAPGLGLRRGNIIIRQRIGGEFQLQ